MSFDPFTTFYDPLMATFEALGLRRWRAELLADVTGDVLELGAGTGANLPHYGPGLNSLTLVEPSDGMRAALEPRAAERGGEVLAGFAEDLPMADNSVDVVVFGLVLCTVRDPAKALSEAKRVLRPGGQVRFIEHVVSDRAPLSCLHQAVTPGWRIVAGGCHLNRDTTQSFRDAGFRFETLTRSWFPGTPLLVPVIRGVAVPVEPV